MSRLKRERTKIHEFGENLMENEFISPNFFAFRLFIEKPRKI